MEVQKDFRDLLELLDTHKVEYMIVGAYALAFHGAPRYTGDMDIFVKPAFNLGHCPIFALKWIALGGG